MNEEEMREYINKLENEKEELIKKSEYVTTKNEELAKELESKENEVKNLKLKNYELFVQIPHSYDNRQNESVEEIESIPLNDIINMLKKGK